MRAVLDAAIGAPSETERAHMLAFALAIKQAEQRLLDDAIAAAIADGATVGTTIDDDVVSPAAAIASAVINTARDERLRQAAYLYTVVQSAFESDEQNTPATEAVLKIFDAGVMWAARALLDNDAGAVDPRTDAPEWIDEIRADCGVPHTAEHLIATIQADTLRAYADEYHGTIEGSTTPTDYGTGIEYDAHCSGCGASVDDDGCPERAQLLWAATEHEKPTIHLD